VIKPTAEPRYKRVLLKLGGEGLAGKAAFGIDPDVINEIAKNIIAVKNAHNTQSRSWLAAATLSGVTPRASGGWIG